VNALAGVIIGCEVAFWVLLGAIALVGDADTGPLRGWIARLTFTLAIWS
jgi:hypothetical protein